MRSLTSCIFPLSLALLLILSGPVLGPGPAVGGWNPLADEKSEEEGVDEGEIKETIKRLKASDPSIDIFFKKAYGYAVFPSVGKGGLGYLGGAHGKGKVYKKGRYVGRTTLTQVTVGLQLGGQIYSEIIFFKDKKALSDFQEGNFELGAQASAVALTSGASVNADYKDGIAVFTATKGGLMYEASVGGQKFTYESK